MNEVVRGKVSRLATFGAFVELAEGIEGLCHMSEVEESRRKKEEGSRRPEPEAHGRKQSTLEVGKEYDFKIVKLDPDQRRIGLSTAPLSSRSKKRNGGIPFFKTSSTATIGDVILSKGRPL